MKPSALTRYLATFALAASAFLGTAAHAQLSVYVVRHGQTDWNRDGLIQGGADNPPNVTGREQAAALARTLAEVRPDAVYVSTQQRARQTAAVFEGRAPVVAMDELRERFFGKFEGASAINQGNDEIYRIDIAKSGGASIWKLIPRTKLGEL